MDTWEMDFFHKVYVLDNEFFGPHCHCGGGGGGGGDGGQAGSFGEGGEFGTSGGSYTGGSLGSGMSYAGGSEPGGWSWSGAKGGFAVGSALGGLGLGLAGGLVGGLSGMAEGDPGSGGPGAQGGPGGGYGSDLLATVRESNPILEKTSLASPDAGKVTPQEQKPKKKRGRTENLMTGPLGLMGDPSLERKSLYTRSLRSTLGF